MLSWFGGVRMKRKPLRFEEQRWLLRFHTHQDQFQEMMYHPHFVKLPESIVPEVEDTAKVTEDGAQSGGMDSKIQTSVGSQHK